MLRPTLCSFLLCAATTPVLASGQLDPDFNGNGVLFIDAAPNSGFDRFEAGLIDVAGRYVGAGRANATDGFTGLVMRFMPSGQPDAAFGIAGKVRIPPVAGFSNIFWSDIAELPDGQLIVAGRASDSPSPNGLGPALVCQLLPNGALDLSFGDDGCALPAFAPGSERDRIYKIALQTDGRLVLLGTTDASAEFSSEYVVARLDVDGSLDACFGDVTCQVGGVLIEPEPEADVGTFTPYDLALAPDGRIVIAGGSSGNQGSDMALIRLLPTGSVDVGGFGNGGHRLIAFNEGGNNLDIGRAVVVRSDGSIVITGTVNTSFAVLAGIAAVDAFGAPIISFGINGRRLYFFNDVSEGHVPTAIRLQDDGKLLVAGYADYDLGASPDSDDCGVARFLPNGQLDPVFGFSGVNTLDSNGGVDQNGQDLCYDFDADGRHIVLFGQRVDTLGGSVDSLLMRLERDGLFKDGFEPLD